MESKEVLEALIFSADGTLAFKEIERIIPDISREKIDELISELNDLYLSTGRSFRIEHASGGYIFVTLEHYAPYIRAMHSPIRLSGAALEVLAVIAYKGPCSKQAIDTIRGVDSTSSLKNLIKHQLINIKPGKPMKYYTTDHFLEVFGLNSLSDLPDIKQFEEVFS
ncbi:MAG: SMC-Scp complex subunit ScpB [Deltaproteobacteria bacterium]|nr:SMC-Scp complex subunit ScpB [Deltaproteobacteria bacterium]